ncbi:MAG TPA: carboxymuconolactone decarboxylase family protein [Nitrospinota bacterium]|nr:carboxymuconolactone decarboxylase family protein [Nitrospinota bacterium]
MLDKKTTILLKLAASMAFGCIFLMKHNFSVAKEIGITDDEIGVAQAIVMSISGGRVSNQFREAREKK